MICFFQPEEETDIETQKNCDFLFQTFGGVESKSKLPSTSTSAFKAFKVTSEWCFTCVLFCTA